MTKEELEKAADEYYYDKFHVTLNIGEEYRLEQITNAFKDGADYGYTQGQIKNYSDLCNQRKLIYQELVKVFTDQLGILDKEDDELFSLKAIEEIINSVLRED